LLLVRFPVYEWKQSTLKSQHAGSFFFRQPITAAEAATELLPQPFKTEFALKKSQIWILKIEF
jgi:hypothetical protein